MTTRTSGPLISVLEVAISFLHVVLWFCVVAFVLFAVTLLVFVDLEDAHFSFPLSITQGPRYEIESRGAEADPWEVRFVAAEVTTPSSLAGWGALVGAPFLALMAFVLGRLKRILDSLRNGSPFIAANATRLRQMGIAIVLFEVLHVAVRLWVVAPMIDALEPIEGPPFQADVWPSWTILILGGLVLLLSEVFRQGTAMQDEQALTV